MAAQNGVFIVIEGTDASGKTVQFELLKDRLLAAGKQVVEMDFPRYDKPSSLFIRDYLKGKFGSAGDVGPYTSSLFYALDRYEAAGEIRQALAEGKIVLSNRFTGSNMAHQGTKFANQDERRGYYIWLDNLEFQMLGIPRPDVSLVLTAPFSVIWDRLSKRTTSRGTESGKDVHEANPDHIRRSITVYEELCSLFPSDFKLISSAKDGKELSIQEVSDEVWQALQPLLGVTPEPSVTKKDQPFLKQLKNGQLKITEAGREELEKFVSSPTDPIYAFTDKLNPTTIAALLAGISRYGGDVRQTLLNQFGGNRETDGKHTHKLLKTYGDESVGQLFSHHLVVEQASQLLAKKLEWGRLGTYIEQPSHLVRYDQKDPYGNYKYHTPEYLDPETKEAYTAAMDQLFDIYAATLSKMISYIREHSSSTGKVPMQATVLLSAFEVVRPLLPLAAKTTVGLYLSAQAQENLIAGLLSDELPEAWETGQSLLRHSRMAAPTYFEQGEKSDKAGATIAYRATTRRNMKRLESKYLPRNHTSTKPGAVTLNNYWPQNELDIVADVLYEHSDQSLADIKAIAAALPYEDKAEILRTYVGQRHNNHDKPGRALEKLHYSFDIICDFDTFKDIQRHRIVDDLEWQQISPRFGFDVPEAIEQAGLVDQFQECFDISIQLHSTLQAAGYNLESQYATLLGHKLRWKMTVNAREVFHMLAVSQQDNGRNGYQKLVKQLHEKISEVHPLLGELMG